MGERCEQARVDAHMPKTDYNFALFLTYVLYVPLLIAGPIISFNDFAYQLKRKPSSISVKALLLKAVRWIACLLLLEIMIHYCYIIAINKTRAWAGTFTPLEVAVLCYLNLNHIWLKLLVIWRFFGWWAEADGIETVDNMHRCMNNNYSVSGFWRYIYVPLGGKENYLLNLAVVFTFVAVWHDLDLNLLAWGWLVALFMVPEIAAKRLFPEKKWGAWPFYRHLCAVGAVFNILLMISVNLIGFAGGVGVVRSMIFDVFGSKSGSLFILGTFLYFFSISQIMFEVREEERRQRERSGSAARSVSYRD
ncbi:glycerol transporter [Cladochytrium tenue]|nr:glycerol transporter [Cladochytrium tenue]